VPDLQFQAEDVLLAKLAIELDAKIPILFLDTGYHFRETMLIGIALQVNGNLT